MNTLFKNIARFILLALFQVLVFNQLELGYGIHIMIYPLFIMLLPFEMGIISLLPLAFLMGFIVDIFSNTYGLHASSLLMMTYFRPRIFKMFSPIDGYDPIKEPTFFDMGIRWFFSTFAYLLLIHHFWYFLIEIFRFSEIFSILIKTSLSVLFSFGLTIVIQQLLYKKVKRQ